MWLTVWEKLSFEEFQDGRHGGHFVYQNGMILAILNLHAATIPSTKFQLNPTYGSGDVKNVADGRMTDNRPWHKLTCLKAPGELTNNRRTLNDQWSEIYCKVLQFVDFTKGGR